MKTLGFINGIILKVLDNKISAEDALEIIRMAVSEQSKVTEKK